MIDPKRGEIWSIYLEPIVGQEIHSHGATRPGIVVSSNALRAREIHTIVPVTAWQEKWKIDPLKIFLPPTSANGIVKDSAAETAQVRTVSLERFNYRLGVVTDEELEAIVLGVGMVIEHP